MKTTITAICILLATTAHAEYAPPFQIYSDRTVCHYEEVTTVINEGEQKCLHEWVDEPPVSSTMVLTVHCTCGCDFGNGGHKICRKCLRKVRTYLNGTPVKQSETEYEKLNRLIPAPKQ